MRKTSIFFLKISIFEFPVLKLTQVYTLSDKISADKSAEILPCCRKFCPPKNFVRRKFCPPKYFVRRNFVQYCFVKNHIYGAFSNGDLLQVRLIGKYLL